MAAKTDVVSIDSLYWSLRSSSWYGYVASKTDAIAGKTKTTVSKADTDASKSDAG